MISNSLKAFNSIRTFTTYFSLGKQNWSQLTVPRMSKTNIKKQEFDYFLVLDFEATCDNEKNLEPQEIIEFPVLKVSGNTFEVEATFHHYVEPVVHRELTTFCTELTGIIQAQVDGQPNLQQTLTLLDQWMAKEGLLEPGVKSICVTCGDWDLKTMLPGQCSYFGLPYPDYLKKWVNIKRVFEEIKGIKPRRKGDLIHMLEVLNVEHTGHYHSGIDDCKNNANILKALAQTGYVFRQTGIRS